MKKIFLFLFVSLVPLSLSAEELKITVKGMVCSFCAQGIKKNLSKLEVVKSVEVNLETKIVQLSLKENVVLNDEDVKKIINEAGYDVMEIKREK